MERPFYKRTWVLILAAVVGFLLLLTAVTAATVSANRRRELNAISPPAPQGSWDCPGEGASKSVTCPRQVSSQLLDAGSLESLCSSLKTAHPQQRAKNISQY